MLRAMIFDLGRVLVHVDFEIGYRRMSAACGLDPAEVSRRLQSTGLLEPYEKGQVSSREFAARACEALGAPISFDAFCAMFNCIFDRGAVLPEETIAQLHRRYRLVLLSNTSEIHFEYLRTRLPSLRHFDAFTLSYELGAAKPEPAIYADAVAKAGCAAGECVFTDDIAAFVEGARACGLRAVQFLGIEQWTAAMGEITRGG
jgi:putative hydrolase of the HAD superfamily